MEVILTRETDLVLSAQGERIEVFTLLVNHLETHNGVVIKRNFDEGIITAAWPYGIEPLGKQITLRMTEQSERLIRVRFTARFKDYPDITGGAEAKAKWLLTQLVNESDRREKSHGVNQSFLTKWLQKTNFFALSVGSLLATNK